MPWAALAAGVAAAALSANEGFRRAAYFHFKAMPILLHYRLTQLLTRRCSPAERHARFKALHERYAPVLLDTIHKLVR